MNDPALLPVLRLAADGQPDAAREAFLHLMREAPGGDLKERARLASRLGLSTAAVRCLQLHLDAHPGDDAARTWLAELYEDRGEPERAHALRSSGPQPAPDGASEPAEEVDAGEADLLRLVDRLEGREGVVARMWRDPSGGVGYSPVQAPLTPALLQSHLRGAVTLGTYLVREDQTVRFVVFDIDADRKALEAATGSAEQLTRLRGSVRELTDRLRGHLRAQGLDPVLVDSGHKGRHLWIFLRHPAPAGHALAWLRAQLAAVGPVPPSVHVDLFPRQATVPEGGLGNLVKLPLGVHLRSGRRAAVLTDDHEPLPPDAALRRLLDAASATLPHVDEGPAEAPADAPSPAETAGSPPPVPAPAAAAPWTEADFDRSPWVGVVLAGCDVLRHLVRGALEKRQMPAQGPVVLNHTLGHLADGPTAVNYLYDRVPGVAPDARMGAPHRGSPMGCSRIRTRLGALIAEGVPCACTFPEKAGAYPHPLRHLDDLPPSAPAPTLDDLLGRYATLLDRLAVVSAEVDTVRGAVVRALQAVPDRAWAIAGGEWRLETDAEGADVLRFSRSDGADGTGGGPWGSSA